ncbi:MAG: ImpA family metalloprotease [Sphaerotilus natans]
MNPVLSPSASLSVWRARARVRACALGASALLAACGGGGEASETSSGAAPQARAQAVVDPVTAATGTGDASGVTLAQVMSATRTLLAAQPAEYAAIKQALFGLNADGSRGPGTLGPLDWNPSHDSVWFSLLDTTQNRPILVSNWSYKGGNAGTPSVLAVAGTLPSGTRYAAFGGNPLGVRGNAATDQLMQRTIAWLTRRTSFAGLKVVTAHLPGTETYWFPHEGRTRSWLASTFPGVTINGITTNPATQADNRCDGDRLDACLQGAHLLVIGREQGPQAYDGPTVMKAVQAAQSRGIPVLYLHHYRDSNDLSGRLLEQFGLTVTNNYWADNGLQAFDAATLPAMPAGLGAVQALVDRLDRGTFTSTWSGCASSYGRVGCSGDATYMAEFGTPAGALRTALRELDASGRAIFSTAGYRLEKLLVLLGDKYREPVSYPMSKLRNGADFYRAHFSDIVSFQHRPYAAVAKNLGNFSGAIPATTPALTRTVTVTLPVSGTRDVMTGLYVMPGRRIKIVRTDAGTGAVRVGINMLRDTTWVFNEPSGLDRPTQLASPRAALVAGQPKVVTSAYGGPLFLHVDAAASGAQTVTVQVSGVTTHPVLRDATDPAQVAAFQAELAATPTNWVGLATDTLTLHSTLPNFRQSLALYGGDLSRLVAETWSYTIQDTYELAGFNAATPGQYRLSPEVAAFCSAQGWDCTGTQHRRDVMQHVISDVHATCGSGCSGNPYDQDWAFQPLGWGESHEIGHNLQRSRLNIHGGQSGEVSNNIFPVHKRMRYNLTPAGLASPLVDRSGTGKAVFDTLKAAQASTDPVAAAYAAIWSDPAYAANNSARLMFYRQLVEHARHHNPALGDGWALMTLLHLLDRNFDANKVNWPAVAASYGFGTYASFPSSISGNDFMLVAASFIVGRDLRPLFDLWGVTYTATAAAQVAAHGRTPVEPLLFPMSQVSQIPARVGAPVRVNAAASYPSGY